MERKFGRFDDLEKENRDLKGQLNSSVHQIEQFKMKSSLLEENVSIMGALEETMNRDQAIKAELIEDRERQNEKIRGLTLQLQTSSSKMSALEA